MSSVTHGNKTKASTRDHWCTPPEITERLHEFWGGPPKLDPCSNERSIVGAKRAYTAGGLHLPWMSTTYSNPPYSGMVSWVDKGIRELQAGNVEELITLWPVATSTRWWKRAVSPPKFPLPYIVFPKRLAFINEHGVQQTGCSFDSVLFLYYRDDARLNKFIKVFASMTNWGTLA